MTSTLLFKNKLWPKFISRLTGLLKSIGDQELCLPEKVMWQNLLVLPQPPRSSSLIYHLFILQGSNNIPEDKKNLCFKCSLQEVERNSSVSPLTQLASQFVEHIPPKDEMIKEQHILVADSTMFEENRFLVMDYTNEDDGS